MPHCIYVIKVFKDAMLFFSCSMPNLVTVIPAMDHIDKVLTTDAFDRKLQPSIHAALVLAKNMLNCYYDKTDHSEVYHIAMSMFPILMM